MSGNRFLIAKKNAVKKAVNIEKNICDDDDGGSSDLRSDDKRLVGRARLAKRPMFGSGGGALFSVWRSAF